MANIIQSNPFPWYKRAIIKTVVETLRLNYAKNIQTILSHTEYIFYYRRRPCNLYICYNGVLYTSSRRTILFRNMAVFEDPISHPYLPDVPLL